MKECLKSSESGGRAQSLNSKRASSSLPPFYNTQRARTRST